MSVNRRHGGSTRKMAGSGAESVRSIRREKTPVVLTTNNDFAKPANKGSINAKSVTRENRDLVDSEIKALPKSRNNAKQTHLASHASTESTTNNLHERLSQIIFGDTSLTEKERRFLGAAERGDMNTLIELVEDNPGLNVNCIDYLGRSALQLAVLEEQTEVIDYLIPRMQLQRVGEAWLHAIDRGNLAICEQILQHPFHRNTRVRNQLLGNDSFFSTETENLQFSADMSPIILAAHRNNVKLIQLLLASGAVIPRPHAYDCNCTSCSNQRKFDSVRHSRSRLSAYKGLASQAYMSLSSNDPLHTAFELSKELSDLSRVEKEFKMDYVNLSNQCKDYTVDLENLCRSTDELLTVLKGKADAKQKARIKARFNTAETGVEEKTEGSELNMLKLAVKTKQKKFIAHPTCQQQLSIFWYSGFSSWQHFHPLLQFIIVMMVGIFMPILVLVYFFVPVRKVQRFLQSPIMKFMMHAMSHVIFLLLLGLLCVRNDQLFRQMLGLSPIVTSNPSRDQIKDEAEYLYLYSIVHILVVLWVLGYLRNEVSQIYADGPVNYFGDWWNYLDFSLILLYVAAYSTLFTVYFRISNLITFSSFQNFLSDIESRKEPRAGALETPIAIFNVFFSFANVMSFLRMASFLPANEQVGPLQISLGRMLTDVVKFGFIFVLVLAAFLCALTNLYGMYSNEGTNDSFTSLEGTFKVLYWSTFGMGDPSAPKFQNDSRIFIQNSGYILYGMYTAASIVVLVNMLIAMMTDSFEQIKDDEDVEWKYARARLWMTFIQDAEFLPVPFNLLPSRSLILSIFRGTGDRIMGLRMVFRRHSSAPSNAAKLHTKNRKLALTNGLNRENMKDGLADEKYDIIMRKIVRRYLHSMLYSGGPQNEGETVDSQYILLKQSNERMKAEIGEIKSMLAEALDCKMTPSYNNPRVSINMDDKNINTMKL